MVNGDEGAKIFILRIDRNEDRELKGNMLHVFSKKEYVFSGLTDAILQMERIMDQLDYPEKNFRLREFQRDRQGEEKRKERKQDIPFKLQNEIVSFIITVYFRQNCSWQGEVHWIGYGKCYFRSVLELINLIDKAAFQKS